MLARPIYTSAGPVVVDTEPGNTAAPIRVKLGQGFTSMTVFLTEQQAFDIEERLWEARHEIEKANSAKKGGAA